MDRILGFFDPPMLIDLGLQIFNSAVMCAVLAYLVYIPVKSFLKKRSDRIREQLESAERDYNDAKQVKADYEAALKDIDKERLEILELARKKALENEAQIIARAKDEAEAIKGRAMLDISREREHVNDEIRSQLVELSTALAGRYVAASIDSDTQTRMLDDLIAELGDATWQS